MTKPTVVDANCMKYFQEERVSQAPAAYTQIIEKAIERACIAIDDELQAQQEYNDCCRPSAIGLNLCDWIADQLVARTIVAFKMDRSAERELSRLGVPKKDLKWPAIAKGAEADAIVTEDIDLFDPRAKSYNAKAKSKIRENGGCVSRYLYKKHGIAVMTANQYLL